MDFGELTPLGDHRFGVAFADFGRDRAIDERGDLLDDVLEFPALFSDEGWVRGNAGKDAVASGFADFFDIRGIDE